MLDQLIEKSKGFDSEKRDFGPVAPANSICFVGDFDTLSLIAGPELWEDEVCLGLTDHAAGQVCGRLGPAAFPGRTKPLPREYLFDACPGGMAAEQLNHWIDVSGDLYPTREWFIRAYRDSCRAVLTNRYATVDVTETLEWVKGALDSRNSDQPVTLYNPVVTPDILHLKVIFQEVDTGGNNGHYGIGGYITTGEIGNRRLGVFPLIQRISCANSIVVQKSEFAWEHVHTGNRAVLRHLLSSAIYQVLEGSVESLDRLLKAQGEEIPDFAEHVDDLAKKMGWTTVVKDQVLIGTEGQETLFGLINGVSATARDTEDAEDRVAMELFAGELLMRKPQGVLVR